MALAHLAADGQPIHAGQHPVQDEQLRVVLFDQHERGRAVECLIDGVAIVFELRADQVAEIRFVFDHQYRRHVVSRSLMTDAHKDAPCVEPAGSAR